jgi:hypothetical protein
MHVRVVPHPPLVRANSFKEDPMNITAKFESRCPKCGKTIFAGSQVSWERGKPAAHVECPAIDPADIADSLLNEYDALQYAAGRAVAQEMAAEGLITPNIPKGINRVKGLS